MGMHVLFCAHPVCVCFLCLWVWVPAYIVFGLCVNCTCVRGKNNILCENYSSTVSCFITFLYNLKSLFIFCISKTTSNILDMCIKSWVFNYRTHRHTETCHFLVKVTNTPRLCRMQTKTTIMTIVEMVTPQTIPVTFILSSEKRRHLKDKYTVACFSCTIYL